MSFTTKTRTRWMQRTRRLLPLLFIGVVAAQMILIAAGLVLAHQAAHSNAEEVKLSARLNNYQKRVLTLQRLADSISPQDLNKRPSQWGQASRQISHASQLILAKMRPLLQEPPTAGSRIYLEEISSGLQELRKQNTQASEALRRGDYPGFLAHCRNAKANARRIRASIEKLSEEVYAAKDISSRLSLAAVGRSRMMLLALSGMTLLLLVPTISYARLLRKYFQANEQVLALKNSILEQRIAERTRELQVQVKEKEKSDARLTRLIDSNMIGIVISGLNGRIREANRAFLQRLGYMRKDLARGLQCSKIRSYECAASDEAVAQQLLANGYVQPYETNLIRKDGSRVPALIGQVLIHEDEILSIVFDLTEEKKAGEQFALLASVVETAAEAIVITDRSGAIQWTNSSFSRLTGYAGSEVLGKDLCMQESAAACRSAYAEMWATVNSGRSWRAELLTHRKDGSSYVEEMSVSPIRGSDGEISHFVAFKQDVSARKEAEKRARFLAYHDALTGLPNRHLLRDRLEKALARARRNGELLAVLFVDLDRFKTINDSLGHSAGDIFLKESAARLQKLAREQDTVARLGGDEFVFFITGLKHPADAAMIADRIMKSISKEVVIQGHPLSIGASVGISMFPGNGDSYEALLKNADIAMYSAKEAGRSVARFFAEEMNLQAAERLTIQSGLQLALERDEFFLQYQPQVDGVGRIVGVEALLRWRHPVMGTIPPGKFIPVAANSGIMISIGEWVLRKACLQARQWECPEIDPPRISVNVTAIQLQQHGFFDSVRRILDETGLRPDRLELEITEETLIQSGIELQQTLESLRNLGVSISLDDFGTGYSCLSYLQRLPVNQLKIDRSFVAQIGVNSHDTTITATIIQMAKNLNLEVIAEGVENEAQLSFLWSHGCDLYQGFLFSEPLSAVELEEQLKRPMFHDGVFETLKCVLAEGDPSNGI